MTIMTPTPIQDGASTHHDPIARHQRRLARPWRIVFIVYLVAMTVGTHWPELEIGAAGQPAPDKLIHLFAFGGLAFLLWQTRWVWVRRYWVAGLIVIGWTLIDEYTQSLPILGRTASWIDIFAGQLGVLLFVVWAWTLGPVGGTGNRTRLTQQSMLLAELFRRPRTWFTVAVVGLLGIVLFGALLAVIDVYILREPLTQDFMRIMIASIAGGIASTHVFIVAKMRLLAVKLNPTKPCFRCSVSCVDTPFDTLGRGVCKWCGSPIHHGQWTSPMDLPLKRALRGTILAVCIVIGLLAFVAGLASVILWLGMDHTWSKNLVLTWHDLPTDMQAAIDLTILALIIALAVRVYRTSQAKLHDEQHIHCRGCGHDLQGTPLDKGVGRCGECGTPFARFAEH